MSSFTRSTPSQEQTNTDSSQRGVERRSSGLAGRWGNSAAIEALSTTREDRRSDRRQGTEQRRDDRRRTTEGGDGSGGHFDSDWAGRALLDRYLFGGGDWMIQDDPTWSSYMKKNTTLKSTIAERLQRLAETLSTHPDGQVPVNETFAAEIENGESIVGYQYLHGTNADAGGFRIIGTATISRAGLSPGGSPGSVTPQAPSSVPSSSPSTVAPTLSRQSSAPRVPTVPTPLVRDRSVTPSASGTSPTPETPSAGTASPPANIAFNVEYQWNDIIDPNPQYTTDNWKSTLAEVLTLGMAEGYTISIRWHSAASVAVSEGGVAGPVSGGWPGS